MTKLTDRGIASPRSSPTSGSATAPVTIPTAVMPTCTVEMTRTGSSISRRAAAAPAAAALRELASGAP